MQLDSIVTAVRFQHDYFLINILRRPYTFLLRKKRSGDRCEECWDIVSEERIKSRCSACYDVGFEGGYHDPDIIMLSFTEPAFQTVYEINDTNDAQSPPTQAWTSGTTYMVDEDTGKLEHDKQVVLNSEDVLADERGRFFRILSSQPTTKDGIYYLRQMLSIQRIPSTDIIYTYPLPERE